MSKDDIDDLGCIEFHFLPKVFFFQFDYCGQILQPKMQNTESNLSAIYWFLKFGKGHEKHDFFVDICLISPLEPNHLINLALEV
jgi:hypothetical protein